MNSKVRCRACSEYVARDESIQIPLGHVCNEVCLKAIKAAEVRKKAKRANGNPIPPETRKAVKLRDRDQCRMCGTKRSLQIHHIRYRSELAGLSNDVIHDYWNLALMCRDCHDKIHSNKRVWQPLLLGMMEIQKTTGRFLTVPQFERLYGASILQEQLVDN